MDRGKLICEELKNNNVEYIAWLPDSESHFIHDSMLNDSALKVIKVCAEGEAIAICAGLHLGGTRGVVLIENQGLYDSGNALKWIVDSQFPLVLMIGYLGYRNLEDSPRGKIWNNVWWSGIRDLTEPSLQTYDISYDLLDSDNDVAKISEAFAEAERTSRPVALLLTSADNYIPGTKGC